AALGMRSKHATDHLPVHRQQFCRPRQDEAGRRRLVEALRENHAIAEDVDLARSEPGDDALALLERSFRVDVLGDDSSLTKLVSKVHRVLDARGKNERPAILA